MFLKLILSKLRIDHFLHLKDYSIWGKYGHMNSEFIGTCFCKFHSLNKTDIFDAFRHWHFKIRIHFYYNNHFKDTLEASDDFKNKQQKCMKQCFLICKSMYILKVYSIHNTLRGNTNIKKISFEQINGTKYALFFLSRVSTH